MEGRDDRHKNKRSKMQQYKKPHPNQKSKTSSSRMVNSNRGIIDIADSSDDRTSNRFVNYQNLLSPSASEIEEIEENEQMLAGDFELMQEMPLTVGNHFQFASEKIWDTNEYQFDKSQTSSYFSLNLKLLNAGLESIPFYKRMDYPVSMFNKIEINKMISAAEKNEITFQEELKEFENNSKNKTKSAGSRKSSGKAPSKTSSDNKLITKASEAIGEKTNEGVDELLNINTNLENIDINKVVVENQSPIPASKIEGANVTDGGGNNEDIQQWLDNVLEE